MAANALDLSNLYGPTEAAIDVTSHSVSGEDLQIVPIGRPIDNTQLYVLDAWRNPTAIGVAGELHIAGEGLARGYLNRPELTAERFIANPFGPAGARMYRTGDLARWRADGRLEFLGRLDDQVKVRGHRIELGEVEAAFMTTGELAQAIVTAVESNPGGRQLVAYVVPQEGERLDAKVLRANVARRMPDFMMPSDIIVLDDIPLNANGKADRKRLPLPSAFRRQQARFGKTPIEKALIDVYRSILNLEAVPLSSGFFELASDSFQAVRLVERIGRDIQVKLSVADVLCSPSLSDLAERISFGLGENAILTQDETFGYDGLEEGVL